MRKTLSRFRQAFPRKRFAAAKIYKLCLKPEERRVVIGMGRGSEEGENGGKKWSGIGWYSRNFDESEFSRFHCNFLATAARENRIKQAGKRKGEERAAVSPRFPPFRESELIYFRSNSIASSRRKIDR